MSKRLIAGAFAALVVTAGGVAFAASPAAATSSFTQSTFIRNSPDDGCSPKPWAVDSFTRTSTIKSLGRGKYRVEIVDRGTFVTNEGMASPAGSPAIANKVEGSIVGSGFFEVTGVLKSHGQIAALPHMVDNSGAVCKANVDPVNQTGNWAKRFFAGEPQSTGIQGWRWEYKTCAEKRVETEKGAEGNITGLLCDPKMWLDKPNCHDRDAEISLKNVNAFEAIEVRFGDGPTRTVQPGKSTDFEFHSGSVQVFVGGVAFGSPFVYQPPRGCKPILSWDAGITVVPTCVVNSTTVKVVNDGHVTFHAKLGDTSQYLKPGESISVTFSAGKTLLWINHKLVKSFEHKAAVCPPPVDQPDPNPPVDNPPAPGAGGGDAGGSDTSGDVPTLPQTGELRSMWSTPTAFSLYGVLIVVIGAALFVLNRRRKFVTEA